MRKNTIKPGIEPRLTAQSCDLFNLPCFQFAQLRRYAPEAIPQIKADYKTAWENWRALILQVAADLGEPYAPPHIERWCNGWQVRAHFFAYFKYRDWQGSAAILSILLNRRRLTASLDWHCYKAGISTTTLAHYNRWPDALDANAYADFELWHGAADEYADYPGVVDAAPRIRFREAEDFYCIGKHLERDALDNHDARRWLVDTLQRLTPLYEACHP
ncbi:MAG: HI_0552 family protein [Cardiobacteriaceae bacterium]|nr:HI_0552 family protein [Cardiobacteriaceae bacterium]